MQQPTTTLQSNNLRSNPPKNLYVKEAAEYMCISERTLWDLIKDRKIRYVKHGRRVILRLKAIDAWLEARES